MKVGLRSENVRPWHEVEHDFLECEYKAVRDRQMQELEMEDDLLSKVPIRYVCFYLFFFMGLISGTEIFEQRYTRSHLNSFGNRE